MYMMEFVPKKKKKSINMTGAIADSSFVIGIAVFYYFIKVGLSAFVLYIILTIVAIVILWQIPETPYFLYSKKRWHELHLAFDQIAKLNQGEPLGVKFDKEDNFEEEQVQEDQ